MSQTATQPAKLGNMAQACDLCRAKKRKCDLKEAGGRCSTCVKANLHCKMTHITKPREKRKRKQMENLEERLRSLESLIKTSVAAKMSDSTQERADMLTPSSNPSTSPSTERNLFMLDALPDDITLGNSNSGTSPTLLQALNIELPSTAVPDASFATDPSQAWNSPDLDPYFGMTTPALATTDTELIPKIRYNGSRRCSMPPVQGGLFLLQEFLADFNAAVPVFDPATITSLFQKCYANMATGQPIEWVALKVVLGIAHRLRAMSPLGVAQDSENAQIYLQECIDVVPELLMLRPSLLLAQCYLGLAAIISTSSLPYPAQVYVTLAMRVIQDLHVNDPKASEPTHSPDSLQLQHVFWVAFFMDADMAMRAGRLPSLSPRLINVELPGAEDLTGDIAADGGEFKANVFRLRVELALLEAEFMEQVLLPLAARSSDCPEDTELRSINSRLEDWRRNWLFEMDTQDLRNSLHRSDLVHVVVLESTYFSTAYTFCAHIAPVVKSGNNPFSAEGLMMGMSKQKAQKLYKDARRFIDLLRLIPGDDIACNWLSLESIVSALVIVLAGIIFDPMHESSKSDLAVSRSMLQLLHKLSSISRDDGLVAIQSLCVKLCLKAESVIRGEQSLRR